MACTHISHCELYAQFAFNSALEIWKTHYCEGDFTRCARYQLALADQPVPLNLLPNGTKVEAPRAEAEYGATAMFNAILKHRASMVVSLLRAGVNVNIQNSEGATPLMAAASTGDVQILRMLLAKGADPVIVNHLGETAHDMALRGGFKEAAELLTHQRSAPQAAPRMQLSSVPSLPSSKQPGLLKRLLSRL
jgi:ankyrin repeat protein